jgi:hypothetical protein
MSDEEFALDPTYHDSKRQIAAYSLRDGRRFTGGRWEYLAAKVVDRASFIQGGF